MFAGSTIGDTYLKDETGGRRFWPITVGRVSLSALERNRDQLWAEAVHLFQSGCPWWLDNPELVAATMAEQPSRFVADPWDEKVAGFIASETRCPSPKSSATAWIWRPDDGRRRNRPALRPS